MWNNKRFEWVDIIAPHFRYCVIPRASIDHFVPVTSSASSSSVDYSGLITSLTARNSDHHVLLPFIAFISVKLLSLDIRPQHGNVITTDFLRRALTACPNVTEFQIGKPENSVMIAFMEVYERGKCQVERLHLFDGSVFAALAEMLEVNRTIEYLEIDIRKDLRAEYASGSSCRPYIPSTSVEPPMKRPRRAGSSEMTESGWRRLDDAVISSIFAFVAEILTRDILISTVYGLRFRA